MVRQSLDWRDGDNVDLQISRDINDYIMVLIKKVGHDPDMGVKTVHQSIDDDSKASESEIEGSNDENAPNTLYCVLILIMKEIITRMPLRRHIRVRILMLFLIMR